MYNYILDIGTMYFNSSSDANMIEKSTQCIILDPGFQLMQSTNAMVKFSHTWLPPGLRIAVCADKNIMFTMSNFSVHVDAMISMSYYIVMH